MKCTLLAFVGLLGCEIPTEAPQITNVPMKGCPDPWVCGANSPIVKVYRTFDFNLDEQPNAQGITVLGMVVGTETYKLDVRDSHFIATSVDGVVLEGTALRGAKLVLELPTLEQVAITIAEVGWYPEAVGQRLPLETYVLEWADILKPLTTPMILGEQVNDGFPLLEGSANPVCEEVVGEDSEELGLRFFESTVFEGDRFDPVAKTVKHAADDRWFNIGCGKHLLSKLRLTRNTMHTAKSWQNVQAAMKMLSADYCGTGQPFSVPGVPIVWRDRALMDFGHPPGDVEARWTELGASCLNEPRLVERGDVTAACPTPLGVAPKSAPTTTRSAFPECGGDATTWDADELVISAHY